MDFISSISFLNEPLVSWTFLEHFCHHFWVGATANPPKSDDFGFWRLKIQFVELDFSNLIFPTWFFNPGIGGKEHNFCRRSFFSNFLFMFFYLVFPIWERKDFEKFQSSYPIMASLSTGQLPDSSLASTQRVIPRVESIGLTRLPIGIQSSFWRSTHHTSR